jgi:hypothetical protein
MQVESFIMKQLDAGQNVGYIYLTKMEGFRVYTQATSTCRLY